MEIKKIDLARTGTGQPMPEPRKLFTRLKPRSLAFDINKNPSTEPHGENATPPRFYRLPKVLEILQISRAKFLRMVQFGLAPTPIKMARCSLYIADEIDKFALALVESSRTKRPFDIDALILSMNNGNAKVKK